MQNLIEEVNLPSLTKLSLGNLWTPGSDMRTESREELLTIDQWEDSGRHDNGGPYESPTKESEPQQPPAWVQWWAKEQRLLVESLADRLATGSPRTEKDGGIKRDRPKFKLTKMTAEDDPEAYLNAFERMATMAGWPKAQWATMLAPYLSGPVQMAVDTLPVGEVLDYDNMRWMILTTLNITEHSYRARMRGMRYEKEKGARWAANLIRSNGLRWLKPQEKEIEEVVECIWLEQFETILPPAAQKWVLTHRPRTLEEAVRVMECFEEAERYSLDGGGARGEVTKGSGPPKGKLGSGYTPQSFTPSGRGRRMEGEARSDQRSAARPEASAEARADP